MSLILEALKKSEAKRRLGEAPDLGTPFSAPRRRSMVLPVVAVLIVAALIWWVVRTPSPAPPATKGNTTAQVPATKSVSPPPTPGQKSGPPLHAVTGDNDLQPTPAPTNLPKAAPSSKAGGSAFVPAGPPDANPMATMAPRRTPEEIRERRRGGNPDKASRLPPFAGMGRAPPATPTAAAPAATVPTRPVAAVAATAPASPVASAPKNVAPSVTPPASAPVVAPAVAAISPPAAGAPTIANAPVATRAPKTPGTIGLPAVPAATPGKSAAPSASAQPYSELPFSVRKSLPELRLSMHVYVPDPAQRFVILNDSRIVEGEKTTDDVSVREIRPDGVVLEFQGQRFFYPRDGL